ncbi:hypothetical protein FB451DRAFT_1463417 [Mycena latifolia]|nr:hypothetical protein FB451DRAFT_1463417 [Mycena latifolia]
MTVPRMSPTAKSRRTARAPAPYTVTVSPIEDLGRTFTEEEKAEFERQAKLTSRKAFRNAHGRRVWPAQLESAMLDALYAYFVMYGEKEAARKLRKHLTRNLFISDHIFETTNQVRTAKQVGSRLQTLRKATDPYVKMLLGDRRRSALNDEDMKPLTSTRPLVSAATDDGFIGRRRLAITITSRSACLPASPPEITLGSQTQPQSIQLRTLQKWQPSTSLLRGMDNTVVLLSPIPLNSYSVFEVFKDEELCWISPPAHLVPNGIHNGKWCYVTCVAADLWPVIAYSSRPDGQCFQWTILQLLFCEEGDCARDNPLFEVDYKFQPSDTDPEIPRNPRTQAPTLNAPPQKVQFIQAYPPSPFPTSSSTSLPELASPESKEAVFSTSGTFFKESVVVPYAHRPPRALSMPVSTVNVYSDSGTYQPAEFVSTGTTSTASQPTLARPDAEQGQNGASDAAARAQSEPLFSSLANWNKVESAVSPRGCETRVNTIDSQQATHSSVYSSAGCFNDRHTVYSVSEPPFSSLANWNKFDFVVSPRSCETRVRIYGPLPYRRYTYLCGVGDRNRLSTSHPFDRPTCLDMVVIAPNMQQLTPRAAADLITGDYIGRYPSTKVS